ncbi:hypothetical protein [Staphylococcus marylandisciuri]|nr:hypothetical protein [Staphylococcus marylandisciuri]
MSVSVDNPAFGIPLIDFQEHRNFAVSTSARESFCGANTINANKSSCP